MKAIRRLGGGPTQSAGRQSCPDFFELDNGDFAIIGEDITADAGRIALPDAALGPNERLIRVPRRMVTSAKPNIPDA